MSQYRHNLPQLSNRIFFTDGGLETTMVFHEGIDLPDFAAFTLLHTEDGRERLMRYFDDYARTAEAHGAGFIVDTVTWRANPDWGTRQGLSPEQLDQVNRDAATMAGGMRRRYQSDRTPVVISGIIGPRGDGYSPESLMSPAEAQDYHSRQARVLSETEVDFVAALTMTHSGEAIGIVEAAKDACMPVAISFTTETDGRLPSGQTLRAAIEEVDSATNGGAAYFMINCAHPTHFEDALERDEAWVKRIRGIRANASAMSHEELNNAEELDAGDPQAFGRHYRALRDSFGHFNVLGGCCGTDHRHVAEVGKACSGHTRDHAA